MTPPLSKYGQIARPLKVPAHVSVFQDHRRVLHGPAAAVALALTKPPFQNADHPASLAHLRIINDATGGEMDFDLRGSDADIQRRYRTDTAPAEADDAIVQPQGRGRPRLGVVAHEVTLLPRHWDWLSAQRGGASITLRRLVDEARKASLSTDRIRMARDAAYRFMSALAGDIEGFEDAARAMFRADDAGLKTAIEPWPRDIKTHVLLLLSGAHVPLLD